MVDYCSHVPELVPAFSYALPYINIYWHWAWPTYFDQSNSRCAFNRNLKSTCVTGFSLFAAPGITVTAPVKKSRLASWKKSDHTELRWAISEAALKAKHTSRTRHVYKVIPVQTAPAETCPGPREHLSWFRPKELHNGSSKSWERIKFCLWPLNFLSYYAPNDMFNWHIIVFPVLSTIPRT